MTGRRFLLFHVTPRSGHFRASRALEQTLRRLDPNASVTNVDAFTYTSRFVRWAISRSYLSLIRHQPDVWEYLYDNPAVHRQVQQLRGLLHRYQAAKLHRLLDTVRPDAIACTQAYPCGMVADFKKHHGLSAPLVGILTDYAPHLYWFHEQVDVYVVPSEQVKQRFLARGVESSRVQALGIPIDLRFLDTSPREATARRFGLQPDQPILLIMGGSSGFGPLREILLHLDILPHPCQLVVVTGSNRALLAWMLRHRFRHRVVPLGFSEQIPELMELATLLISKPGGLTTSEALAKRLPLVIINPIPGQEAYNARYLLSQGAAVQASGPETVRQTVRDLLDNPERLELLRQRCGQLAHPTAALDTVKLLCDLADGKRGAAQVASHALVTPRA
jgi:processive 1,2-diacylglycerol beta-glucosyltransferase